MGAGVCSPVAALDPGAGIIVAPVPGPAFDYLWLILIIGVPVLLLLLCLLWFCCCRKKQKQHPGAKVMTLMKQDPSLWPYVDPRTRAPTLQPHDGPKPPAVAPPRTPATPGDILLMNDSKEMATRPASATNSMVTAITGSRVGTPLDSHAPGTLLKLFTTPGARAARANQIVPLTFHDAVPSDTTAITILGESKATEVDPDLHIVKRQKVEIPRPPSVASSAGKRRRGDDESVVNVLPEASGKPRGVGVRLINADGRRSGGSPRSTGSNLKKGSGVFDMLRSALGSTLEQAREELHNGADRVADMFDDASTDSDAPLPAPPKASTGAIVVLPRVNSKAAQQQIRRPLLPPLQQRGVSLSPPRSTRGDVTGTPTSPSRYESPEMAKLRQALRDASIRAAKDAQIASNARDAADRATAHARAVALKAQTTLQEARSRLASEIQTIDELTRQLSMANSVGNASPSATAGLSAQLEAAEQAAETSRTRLKRLHAQQAAEVAAAVESARGANHAYIALELDRISSAEAMCHAQAAVSDAEIQAERVYIDTQRLEAQRRHDELTSKADTARDSKVVRAAVAARKEVEGTLASLGSMARKQSAALLTVTQTLESELTRLHAERDVATARRDMFTGAADDDADLAYLNAEQALVYQDGGLEERMIEAEAAAARRAALEVLRARGVVLSTPALGSRTMSFSGKAAWTPAPRTGQSGTHRDDIDKVGSPLSRKFF